ncbi:GNAT family N-acetyltransferase [Shewanella sp. A25]|nr:GNAT family N-acetyltransferase [Shewanella shenzhenensis]
MKPLIVALASGVNSIKPARWNALMGEDNPFTRHEFIHALEDSGSACAKTGWIPRHLCVFDASELTGLSIEEPKSLELESQEPKLLENAVTLSQLDATEFAALPLLAVMPVYQKSHSYGEYVFDWAWAQAYERHGIEYYPKWLNAIPFTPVQGKRIGFAASLSEGEQREMVKLLLQVLDSQFTQAEPSKPGEQVEHIVHRKDQKGISSWHSLFVSPNQQGIFELSGHSVLRRLGTQFHWHNRGYQGFEDFLAALTSRKRKNIHKERSMLQSCGLEFNFVKGEHIQPEQWQQFLLCYQLTYLKRSGHRGYLTPRFFELLLATMPKQIVLLVVKNTQEEMIAGALYFIGRNDAGQSCLYGRYWGTTVELEGLHFEACYYQGIQYCIEHGIELFDAGAQGEHKVLRGFEPVPMYSYHNIAHLGFKDAIADFTLDEAEQMKVYMEEMRGALPYKT